MKVNILTGTGLQAAPNEEAQKACKYEEKVVRDREVTGRSSQSA
jgi:hypothetical protein